jgi:hypothetical protein
MTGAIRYISTHHVKNLYLLAVKFTVKRYLSAPTSYNSYFQVPFVTVHVFFISEPNSKRYHQIYYHLLVFVTGDKELKKVTMALLFFFSVPF